MFPSVLIEVILSYLPSKELLPWVAEKMNPENKSYMWRNPYVWESGFFSAVEIHNAPKWLVAQNPACAQFVLSNWNKFQRVANTWCNPALFDKLMSETRKLTIWEETFLEANTNPNALRWMRETNRKPAASNPCADLSKISRHDREIWGNPSAVEILKAEVAKGRTPNYPWLCENSHPWALELLRVTDFGGSGIAYSSFFTNPGIFRDRDFSDLRTCLASL